MHIHSRSGQEPDALAQQVAEGTRKAKLAELQKARTIVRQSDQRALQPRVAVPDAMKAAQAHVAQNHGACGGGWVAGSAEDALLRITKGQVNPVPPSMGQHRDDRDGARYAEQVLKATAPGNLRRPFSAGLRKDATTAAMLAEDQANRGAVGFAGTMPGMDHKKIIACPFCNGGGCAHCDGLGTIVTDSDYDPEPASPFGGIGDTLKQAHPDVVRQMQATALAQTMAGMAEVQARVDDALGVTQRHNDDPRYGPTAAYQALMTPAPVPMISLAWPAGDPRQVRPDANEAARWGGPGTAGGPMSPGT